MQTILPLSTMNARSRRWFACTFRGVVVFIVVVLTTSFAVAQEPTSAEIEFWRSVKDSKAPAELEAYLKKYPSGHFADIARSRLDMVKKTSRPPTPEEYVKMAGPNAKLVAAGELMLDGKRVICGRRPTVLDPALNDYSATYPGFIILNPRLLEKVSTVVKLWIYNVGCAFQFRGPDSAVADCFGVQRGRRQGWLASEGLDEICRFIGPAKGDATDAPGEVRCKAMRRCFDDPKIR